MLAPAPPPATTCAPSLPPPSPPEGELLYWLALLRAEQIGSARAAALIAHFGSPQAAFAASPAALAHVEPPLTAPALQSLLRGPDLEWARHQAERAERLGAAIVPFSDPAYPECLRRIPSPPPVLFVQGVLPLDHLRAVGVVGTRNPSLGGRESCRRFSSAWARNGVRIVSGLARGIDEEAHTATLEVGGETVAVLGCGLDQLDATRGWSLSQRIAQQGLLVSEFPLGAPVVKANFPRRNRIIAGLSQAVVVVEAGERSGALITARNALEQNREILAMPGPPDSPQHTGVFQLLRDGAHLCATPNDLLQVLGWQQPLRSVAPSASPVVKLLSHKSATAEELAVLLCRTIPELQAELVLLELSGEIVRLSGGRYAPAP